jgi:signal peptidase I
MQDMTPPQPVAPVPPVQPRPPEPTVGAPVQDPEKPGILGVISGIVLLLMAPLLAWILVVFVFQSYVVDGPSMQTTLQNHDRLIVLKVPRTLAKITHHAYIPNRGDIIIFNHPDSIDFGSAEKQLIKRVIALPGERVTVKDGQVTVYNKEHPNGFSPDHTMAYGSVISTTSGDVDLIVPAGEVFVCGDNRANSLDSRYFGTVPASNIVGKLGLRIFPVDKAERF